MGKKVLAVVESGDVVFFAIGILVTFFALFALFWFTYWVSSARGSTSPYSKLPMRRAEELSYDVKLKLLRYLYDLHQYDNRIIEFARAAVCRETGRVFPKAITWYGIIRIDWTFLQHRYPGNYVSWGSLTSEQQEIIALSHDSLEGFQTDFSSPRPQPMAVEAKYAFTKPGPLYVDLETKTLLGWKCVPGTDVEVLIVQKPLNLIIPGQS